MKERTLAEIMKEMDHHVNKGNLGKVMDLVDDHGNLIDRMEYAIIDGDLELVGHLETLGVNSIHERFIRVAIRAKDFDILQHHILMGANIDEIIEFSSQMQVPLVELWAHAHKAHHNS